MAPFLSALPLLGFAFLLQFATNAGAAAIDTRSVSPYAPVSASCPSTALVRSADGVGSSEETYVTARKTKADVALAAWLTKTDSSFNTSTLPSVALAVSGGGVRACLCAAGFLQALDSRDSTSGTAGLFQSLTYQTGLSGGGWFTSSFAGNNWPTISTLKTTLWETAFQDTLLDPDNLLAAVAYAKIVEDVTSKAKAGFLPTIVDVWGRLLSYQLLNGADGGVATTLSGLTTFSNFTAHNVPYPIITARSVLSGECLADVNATQYELGPYEFGSWDSGVGAFANTKYLGSNLTAGSPTVSNACITNYDNLGYMLGTSSDIYNNVCSVIPAINSTTDLSTTISALLAKVEGPAERDLFAAYPNPFYKYSTSTLVSSDHELNLVDGGEEDQNVPIWPFIQEARDVGVVIVSDNSADSDYTWPNGIELRTTYEQAQLLNLTKMPYVPTVDTFVAQGLDKHASFFGCDDDNAITIIYVPNYDYSYASNITTATIQYSKERTDKVIANSNLVATQNGTADWPTCVGCAIMKKTSTSLPDACTACFETYCFSE